MSPTISQENPSRETIDGSQWADTESAGLPRAPLSMTSILSKAREMHRLAKESGLILGALELDHQIRANNPGRVGHLSYERTVFLHREFHEKVERAGALRQELEQYWNASPTDYAAILESQDPLYSPNPIEDSRVIGNLFNASFNEGREQGFLLIEKQEERLNSTPKKKAQGFFSTERENSMHRVIAQNQKYSASVLDLMEQFNRAYKGDTRIAAP